MAHLHQRPNYSSPFPFWTSEPSHRKQKCTKVQKHIYTSDHDEVML